VKGICGEGCRKRERTENDGVKKREIKRRLWTKTKGKANREGKRRGRLKRNDRVDKCLESGYIGGAGWNKGG
jgi:hypothetical protein